MRVGLGPNGSKPCCSISAPRSVHGALGKSIMTKGRSWLTSTGPAILLTGPFTASTTMGALWQALIWMKIAIYFIYIPYASSPVSFASNSPVLSFVATHPNSQVICLCPVIFNILPQATSPMLWIQSSTGGFPLNHYVWGCKVAEGLFLIHTLILNLVSQVISSPPPLSSGCHRNCSTGTQVPGEK